MGFIEENRKDRKKFVELWAEYVRTHSDEDWSRQQNVIINSSLEGASMSKEDFLKMKLRDKGVDHTPNPKQKKRK